MRDPVIEALNDEDDRLTRTENEGPVCKFCGFHVNNWPYHYEIDGTVICDDSNCIYRFMEQYRVNL